MPHTCTEPGCPNNVFGGGRCRYHQYKRKMKGGDLYKAKDRVNKQSKIPKESKKRKAEHIRYSEQLAMFKQEHKDNDTYFCFITKEPFKETIEDFCTCHHLRGRTGDYYLDKKYWILVRNGIHLDVFHGRMTYAQLCIMTWWNDFLTRLRELDHESYNKEMRRMEKAHKLTPTLFDDSE